MTDNSLPGVDLRASSDPDLLAAVALGIGLHPAHGVMTLALDRGRITCALFLDLSVSTGSEAGDPDGTGPGGEASNATLDHRVAQVVELVTPQGQEAILIGYGTPDQLAPALARLTDAVPAAGMGICRTLRVTDGRVYRLDEDAQNRSEGTAYDPAATAVADQATAVGLPAPPDLAALQALVEPVTGPRRAAMRAATEKAATRLSALLIARRTEETPTDVLEQAHAAVRQALEAIADGQTLSDADAAWLSVVLQIPAVHDRALHASEDTDVAQQLWSDLTRRAEPELVGPPACLLAITAYYAGETWLAYLAVDRALAADPTDELTLLVRNLLMIGAPPQHLRTILARL